MLHRIIKTREEQSQLATDMKSFKKEEAKKKTMLPTVPRREIEGFLKAVICDIDGTLAIRGDRGIFDFKNCDKDILSQPVKFLLDLLPAEIQVIVLTGREGKFREFTEAWLKDKQVRYNKLIMRDTDDNRGDQIVKKELFDFHLNNKYNILFAIDDRKKVKRMYVENGIFVFDVNQTDEVF